MPGRQQIQRTRNRNMPKSAIEQARLACINESKLRAALEGAEIVPLMLSLVHLTGDAHWLDEAAPHIKGGWSYQADLPDDLQRRIRDALVEVLQRMALGQFKPVQISDDLLNRMSQTDFAQDMCRLGAQTDQKTSSSPAP